MREPVTRHFLREGWGVRWEVPIAGRYADVVAARDDVVVAVELKLTDWRTATRQAIAYQLGAHRTYVALPLARALRIGPRRSAHFQQAGCGLLGVDHETQRVQEVLPAAQSERLLPFMAAPIAAACRRDVPPWLKLGAAAGTPPG